METIYGIIDFGRKIFIRSVEFILNNKKVKYYTKEALKIFNIALVSFGFIIAIVLIKYKPMYKVTILGTEVGYIQNKSEFDRVIEENINNYKSASIDSVKLTAKPVYELELVEKAKKENTSEVIVAMQKNLEITYKYYEILYNGKVAQIVNSKADADKIKSELNDEQITIQEKTTNKLEEVKISSYEVARNDLFEITEKNKSITEIDGIKIKVLPIVGQISSRFGELSRIRSSRHTGLDIAARVGTPIKVVADGVVTCASNNGSYGNLIKVEHGNGVETWYAHTSKMYVKVGQNVTAGDVIGAVGNTGNSTGAHLHLEIRINGVAVNPQNYVYNK